MTSVNGDMTVVQKNLSGLQQISVGTYNILKPQGPLEKIESIAPQNSIGYDLDKNGQPVENSIWRLEIAIKNIVKANLDIICLQEVVIKTFKKLQETFSDSYECVWETHEVKESDGVAIFFKKELFEILEKSSQRVPLKIADTISAERVFLRVDLKNKLTGLVFRVTTFDFFNPKILVQKQKQTASLVEFVHEKSSVKIDRSLIMGVTNIDQYNKYHQEIPWQENEEFQAFKDKGYVCADLMGGTEYVKSIKSESYGTTGRRVDLISSKEAQLEIKPTNTDIRASSHRLIAATVL
jgi:exonuclease III